MIQSAAQFESYSEQFLIEYVVFYWKFNDLLTTTLAE